MAVAPIRILEIGGIQIIPFQHEDQHDEDKKAISYPDLLLVGRK